MCASGETLIVLYCELVVIVYKVICCVVISLHMTVMCCTGYVTSKSGLVGDTTRGDLLQQQLSAHIPIGSACFICLC